MTRASLVQFELAADNDGAAQAMALFSGQIHKTGDYARALDEYQRVLEHLEDHQVDDARPGADDHALNVHQKMTTTYLALGQTARRRPIRDGCLASGRGDRIGRASGRGAPRPRDRPSVRRQRHEAEADISRALDALSPDSTALYVVTEREKLRVSPRGRPHGEGRFTPERARRRPRQRCS